MKIIDKVKLIEQKTTVYIANDGTEFNSENDCRQHDAKLVFNVTVSSMKKISNMPFIEFDIPFHYDTAYFVNSTEELDALITYYTANYQIHDNVKNIYNGPDWYLISYDFSGDHDSIEITSLNKIFAEFNLLFNIFSNKS